MANAEFLRHEGQSLTSVVMCSPKKEYFSVTDKKAHNIADLSDPQRAIAQHQGLADVIRGFGVQVLLIDELPLHPNSVFTQDTALSSPAGFIKMRMGIPTREGEEDWMGNFLSAHNIPCIGEITAPGTTEGGDIILAGNVAFVGVSTRTNEQGSNQVSDILANQGFDVRTAIVPTPFLHIGGAMSVIDVNTILSVEGIFPDVFFGGFEVILAPNDGFITGNVITLGNKELIANEANLTVIKLLKKADFKVHEVNLSEFTKGTGGPSCLIMPLLRRN